MSQNNKIPFAYSISNYNDNANEIFPSIEQVLSFLKEFENPAIYWNHDYVRAHYSDGTWEYVSMRPFIQENVVDEKLVEQYIDDLREKSRKGEEDTLFRAESEERRFWPSPLYIFDRKSLIEREIEKRKYCWKL